VTTSHFKRWIWWWFRTFLILDEFQQFLCKSSSMDDIYNSNHTTVKKGCQWFAMVPFHPALSLPWFVQDVRSQIQYLSSFSWFGIFLFNSSTYSKGLITITKNKSTHCHIVQLILLVLMALVLECSELSNILQSTRQRESNWLPIAFEIKGIVSSWEFKKKSQDPTDCSYLQVKLTTSINQQCLATHLARKWMYLVGTERMTLIRHIASSWQLSHLFSSAVMHSMLPRWPTVQLKLSMMLCPKPLGPVGRR
jgi:hypothetical protein